MKLSTGICLNHIAYYMIKHTYWGIHTYKATTVAQQYFQKTQLYFREHNIS